MTRAACSHRGFDIATKRVGLNADSPSTSYNSGTPIGTAASSATVIHPRTNPILPKNAQQLHAAFQHDNPTTYAERRQGYRIVGSARIATTPNHNTASIYNPVGSHHGCISRDNYLTSQYWRAILGIESFKMMLLAINAYTANLCR